ncbi:MAG: complex I subunit 1 family protein [Candidatus Omnitrophota bacterium]
MKELFNILIFPGFLFLASFGLCAEFLDRKLHARLQNRIGPPWFQPLADFIKLLGKEDLVPTEANPRMFTLMPLFALTAAAASFLYVPLWGTKALYSFNGDVIVVLYLFMIPTLTFFIGGWYSTSLYARIGSVRAVTQMFAYEVPLFMSVLASMLLANTWSLTEMVVFYSQHKWLWAFNLIGFLVALVALLGKLEKVPFDIPEAETEIVAGSFTEYGGRFLAFFRLTMDMELVAGASLLAAVFLPFGLDIKGAPGFALYIVKTCGIVAILSLLRTIFARLRLDQMINFSWRYIVPFALLQLAINLLLKELVIK